MERWISSPKSIPLKQWSLSSQVSSDLHYPSFSKDAVNSSKVLQIVLQKISISDKCCSFELSVHQRILKKNIYIKCSQKCEAAQLLSALVMVRNISGAANQHIRMISEGSCDTEDWSDDAGNSALITEINDILKYIHIKAVILSCNNI